MFGVRQGKRSEIEAKLRAERRKMDEDVRKQVTN